MTDSEQAVLLILAGAIAVLVGIVLAFAKVDRNELKAKSQSNPMMALFRFPAYRWACVGLLVIGGTCVSASGWIALQSL